MKFIIAILIIAVVIFIAIEMWSMIVWCRAYAAYIAIIEHNHPEHDFNRVFRDLMIFFAKNPSLTIFHKRFTDKQYKDFCEIIEEIKWR